MFCSNCGKTIPEDASRCPVCGFRLSGTSFYGASYTSVQSSILPNRYREFLNARTNAAPAVAPDYVKVDQVPSGENVEGQTTYVQLDYGAAQSAPETRMSMRRENEEEKARLAAELAEAERIRLEEERAAAEREAAAAAAEAEHTDTAAEPNDDTSDGTQPDKTPEQAEKKAAPIDRSTLSEAARTVLDTLDRDLEMPDEQRPDLSTEEVTSKGQQGISQEVDELIEQLESTSRRKRRTRRMDYGRFDDREPEAPTEAAESDSDEVSAPADTGAYPPAEEDEDYYPYDEDYEGDEDAGRSPNRLRRILIIVLIVVLAIALFAGGIFLFRRLTSGNQKTNTITDVSEDLYRDGLALIKQHASDAHIEELKSAYTANGSLTELNSAISASAAELGELTAAEPMANDSLFIAALRRIETNIANSVTTDVILSTTGGNTAQSTSNWAIVSNSIAALEVATDPSALTAIANGDVVTAAELQATPSPAPAVNTGTLSKGDASDDVLKLQDRLYELGYLLDDRDGTYGTKTQTAIKMFQQAAGLNVTGVADETTLAAVYADDAPRTEFAQPTSNDQ